MSSGNSLDCPSCGATLAVEDRFTKVVICEYCGQTSALKNRSLDPTGKKVSLADVESEFRIGRKGTLKGESFTVLGRLRYDYEDGFWDEWFISLEGGGKLWIQEDEGEITAYKKESITSQIPPWDEISVGSMVPINGAQVFVTEKNKASITGGLGQLMFRITPGEQIKYVDGNSGGELVSIEFSPEEINFSIGEALDTNDFTFSDQ